VLVRELSNEGIDAFFEQVGPQAGSPLLLAELAHLGGALGRPAKDAGALSHLDSDYVMFAAAIPMTPELGTTIAGHLDALQDAMSARDSTSTSPTGRPTSRRSSAPPCPNASRR
jgi:hypothetical protein